MKQYTQEAWENPYTLLNLSTTKHLNDMRRESDEPLTQEEYEMRDDYIQEETAAILTEEGYYQEG